MRIEKNKLSFLKKKIGFFLENTDIYIFGSRIDDKRKGGDIDILIIGNRKLKLIEKIKIKIEFWKHFGHQKLDIVSFTRTEKTNFKELILQSAIKI